MIAASYILEIVIPDWISWLAAFSAAVLSIWALVSKIRNSGKAEVEVKLADVKHEQEQNSKINQLKSDFTRLVNDLESLNKSLRDLDDDTKNKFASVEKEVKELRSELLRLVIGLKDRL